METMPPVAIPGYIAMLVSSYMDLSGVIMYRHAGNLFMQILKNYGIVMINLIDINFFFLSLCSSYSTC